MSWEALTVQIGLINFAVVSILSLQPPPNQGQGQQVLTRICLALFILATLATTAALGLRLWRTDFDIVAARGLVLAASLAWFAIFAYVWLRMRTMTAFTAPVATLTLLLQFFVGPQAAVPWTGERSSLFLDFHIAGATMGQGLALVASVISVLYLWQQRVLKRKLLEQLTSRLPALDMLEKILTVSLWTGFLFLTAALVSGALYIQVDHPGGGTEYKLKIAWAITVWVWYLSTLLARNVLRISIKRVAQMSLVGFLLLAMTFFGLIFFRAGGGGQLG